MGYGAVMTYILVVFCYYYCLIAVLIASTMCLQVISLAGWVNIMYYVQDAHTFWDWIYFVSLIVVQILSLSLSKLFYQK